MTVCHRPCMTQTRNSSICRELSGTQITQTKYAHFGSNSLAIRLVLPALEAITDDKYQCTYQACIHIQHTCSGFLTQFLICWIAMEILTVVSPVLLWIVLHSAAIWLQLLVQATTVNKYRLAGLSIPSSLTKHLFQLFKCVTALSFPNTMFFHPTVTPAKGLRHKVFCYSFKAVLPPPDTDHRY